MLLKSRLLCTAALGLLLLAQTANASSPEEETTKTSCIQRAQWVSPKDLSLLSPTALLKKAAAQKVVLLGEFHPDEVHHRWQLQTLTQLYAHNSNMVLGFEMFPRWTQPILDRWVRGELSEKEFLKQTNWDTSWKYDADMYLPLFHFARTNRLPMIALNVHRDLIRKVAQDGWDVIPDYQREGIETPRAAHPDYIKSLKEVFSQHSHMDEEEKESEDRFNNFVQSQLTWDGAMAQMIAKTQKAGGNPLVVGIMGSGHLTNGYGVPHQLKGLGLNATVLLPWTLGWDCTELVDGYADAVFGLEEMEPKGQDKKPILGVRIEASADKKGVLIEEIVEDSVAERAGLKKGDLILTAADLATNEPKDLIRIIQQQAHGTWLPLEIQRNGRPLTVVAKFPQLGQ
ncbi:ChaN family lipoprotein [Terasakiella pusilla]|uniref:ChaN family lipoprotein n=1 Tax=Terasakiella pusilla TaxID=64973 RepID=UPI00056E5D2A|nr:ChaN family lipoprotein [Terasakiella pusilla]